MNAPPFELVGIGFLGIGFIMILLFLLGAVVVYLIQDGVKRLNKAKETMK